ncbi:fluoride efflux transporter FluC [Vreelandella malpeensis]|uniref:Fluoride-specific ion channel FluC n=1 Tax=Vreelandella malpeensis TaxID=1172368 RepID=A0ABS8DSP5_9GAMM|nr:CrcB family protein [Halomonas malpeensis]MCB8888875.1 CrcB family protein [Halomonas malpeensis]
MDHGLIGPALVALGAAVGGMARLGVTRLAARYAGQRFPWGTLAVNTSGAFAAGFALGHLGRDALSYSPLGLLLLGGVLGGYTTVSSLSLQTLTLWQAQHRLAAFSNLMGTLTLGALLAGLGGYLGASTT